MRLRVWDVEHGACAMLQHVTPTLQGELFGKLAMIDSGNTDQWNPSAFIRYGLNRRCLDYLFITNADQDHMSDLKGLQDAGIEVDTLIRNPSYTGEQIRQVKLGSGAITADAAWYVQACCQFNQPTQAPFDANMGGITCACFYNPFPTFINTNDLSLVVFIKFDNFSILFPGDLEKAGWRTLLLRQDFRNELLNLNVLVASHHGRESGFCPELFDIIQPQAIVISDKPIKHETQLLVADYRAVTLNTGVLVRTTGRMRHVLTTRRDGWIQFEVGNGRFIVDTEYRG
jgi:beta-lactamase superfamily II metal-dependent hydrolase